MGQRFSGALLAGVVAATIWMAISLWVGMASEAVGLGALICLIGTTVITLVISTVIERGKGAPVRA